MAVSLQGIACSSGVRSRLSAARQCQLLRPGRQQWAARLPARRQRTCNLRPVKAMQAEAMPEPQAGTAGLVREVNAEELEVAIQTRDRPLIVDFSATWCGPCLLLAKELETVAQDLGDKVEILKVDTDIEREISAQLQIQGLPTMIFISTDKSKPALRTEGLLGAEAIKDIITKEL